MTRGGKAWSHCSMLRSRFVSLSLAIGLFAVTSSVDAQRQRRFAIDGTVGRTEVRTQRLYDFNGVFATDAVLAGRWTNVPGVSPVVAVSGATFYVSDDLSCRPVPGGSGECVPELPRVSSKSLFGGVEWLTQRGASVRLLVGRSSFVVCCDGENPSGPVARIDVSTPHAGFLAVVGSASWFRVEVNGEGVHYRSLQFGVRLR